MHTEQVHFDLNDKGACVRYYDSPVNETDDQSRWASEPKFMHTATELVDDLIVALNNIGYSASRVW